MKDLGNTSNYRGKINGYLALTRSPILYQLLRVFIYNNAEGYGSVRQEASFRLSRLTERTIYISNIPVKADLVDLHAIISSDYHPAPTHSRPSVGSALGNLIFPRLTGDMVVVHVV